MLRPFHRLAAIAALAALASAGSAHHSFAMFDRDKTVSMNATVKVFEFKNPHAWLWVTVPGQNGGPAEEWGLESAGPAMLNRLGVGRETFNPGDKIVVRIHPLKDGRKGGEFAGATLANGKTIDMMEQLKKFSSGS